MLPAPLEPNRIYIICTRTTRGTIGRAIQWITRHASESCLGAGGWAVVSPHAHLGPYAHMAILSTYGRWSFDDGHPEGVWVPAPVYEATEKGFVATPLDRYNTEGVTVDVFVICDLHPRAAERIVARCETMVEMGTGYDFAQLIGIGLGRFVWGRKRLRILGLFGRAKVICSEGTAIVIRDESKINICGLYHISVFTPTDIRHTCDIGLATYIGRVNWAT